MAFQASVSSRPGLRQSEGLGPDAHRAGRSPCLPPVSEQTNGAHVLGSEQLPAHGRHQTERYISYLFVLFICSTYILFLPCNGSTLCQSTFLPDIPPRPLHLETDAPRPPHNAQTLPLLWPLAPLRRPCVWPWTTPRPSISVPPPASSTHPERLSPLSATRNLLVPVTPCGYPFTECPVCSVGTHRRMWSHGDAQPQSPLAHERLRPPDRH